MSARRSPLEPVEEPLTSEARAVLDAWAPGTALETTPLLFRLLANHPDLMGRLRPLMAGLLVKGQLSARQRELLILRTTALCGADVEFEAHASTAGDVGIDPALIAQLKSVPSGSWSEGIEDDLLRAADDLYVHRGLGRDRLEALGAYLAPAAIVETLALCGAYALLSSVLNSYHEGR